MLSLKAYNKLNKKNSKNRLYVLYILQMISLIILFSSKLEMSLEMWWSKSKYKISRLRSCQIGCWMNS